MTRTLEAVDGVNEQVRLARLTSVGGAFTAHVVAARLEAEGIPVRLRGAVHSPYQFTVGEMSRVDVYVAEDDMEDARVILLIDEVDATLDLPPQKDRPSGVAHGHAGWVVLVSVILLGMIPFARMVLAH